MKLLFLILKGLLFYSWKEKSAGTKYEYVPPTREEREQMRKCDEEMVLRQLGLK